MDEALIANYVIAAHRPVRQQAFAWSAYGDAATISVADLKQNAGSDRKEAVIGSSTAILLRAHTVSEIFLCLRG